MTSPAAAPETPEKCDCGVDKSDCATFPWCKKNDPPAKAVQKDPTPLTAALRKLMHECYEFDDDEGMMPHMFEKYAELETANASLRRDIAEAGVKVKELLLSSPESDKATIVNQRFKIETLYRRLAAAEADKWQPIETAPKDGTSVLIWAAPWGSGAEARFVEDEGWWLANNDPTDHWGDQQYPTHWQPLPAPPAISADEREGAKHG